MQNRVRWMLVGALTGAVALLVAFLINGGQTGVVVIPGRIGTFQEGPELGPNLGTGDSDTCRKLRGQLTVAVTAMYESFDDIRRFSASYDGEIGQLQAFEKDWRAKFMEQKQHLFTLATCDDFISQWMLALATWRDIFRYGKETVSALRTLGRNDGSLDSGRKIESNLLTLLGTLKP